MNRFIEPAMMISRFGEPVGCRHGSVKQRSHSQGFLVSMLSSANQSSMAALSAEFRSRVAFQPIYAPEGHLHGVEALMRFFESDQRQVRNGLPSMAASSIVSSAPPFATASIQALDETAVSTERVFGEARQDGWIMDLDFFCREEILSEASRQRWNHLLFINVCPESLLDPDHSVGRTDALVEQAGMQKEQIVLEITEETAITNYELFSRTVNHYRDQGYRIAIDDFGSGYAGLKMLASIQPDYLKIDRYFIQDIHREPVKQTIVEALVNICQRLDIALIAEGIENSSEFHSVLNLGIELRQGYFLGRPAFELQDPIKSGSCPG